MKKQYFYQKINIVRSCWAFSALDALEGAIGKKYNKYERLSEQQMVDCSTTNGGCNGGDPQWVFTDVMSKFPSRGVYTNAVYPVRLKLFVFF